MCCLKKILSEVVVLGAGPAGLAVGLGLGSRALVLEEADGAGGLSRSIELDGAVFDVGGHSFHTPHPEIRRLVEGAVELYEQPRDARCYSHGCMIAYPFQKHFRAIRDPAVVAECADGLARASDAPAGADFLGFLEHRFGTGISRHFMVPYNRKLWGNDLTRLAADWVGERVAAPEGVDEAFDEQGGKRKALQSGTRVAYPARGGFGTLMQALAQRVHDIRYRQRVIGIDLKARRVETRDGGQYGFEQLVSTLPLPALARLCRNPPDDVLAAADALECLSLKVILITVGHAVDTEIQRIYCADETVPAHKLAINHNSSPFLRALPRHGIMAEVSCANGERPDDELVTWTIRGLCDMGILKGASDVVSTRVLHVQHAYPMPTHARDGLVARVRRWLDDHGVHTVGRFGEWAYINSDEAMHRGLRLAQRL